MDNTPKPARPEPVTPWQVATVGMIAAVHIAVFVREIRELRSRRR